MSKYKPLVKGIEETFQIGQDAYFTSIAPITSYVVSFEDDFETGYFYAVTVNEDISILDALHIYNVIDVIHRDKPCNLKVMWTEDGTIASLLINDYCQAILDFNKQAGYCRNGFPENKGLWSQTTSRQLTDELLVSIMAAE
ncbi:DUF2251 domain-containing protein [Dyadobacter sp. CY312]|uniref:DUF2251 domain-containing protein n=1 Tax=Dyadobacter sp. CY312 TaxID=2907303 RepID=UPI001F1A54D1|nr:DUF2251 domain-containing protein [Dyadobacter sp. CY312]MCE7039661.1 DUF2251 domain-containing protein [Dyadobacter sp. CY312]